MSKAVCLAGLVWLVFAMGAWGQRVDVWNDPRVEAEYLAVEITGELRPAVELAERIEADLAAIRFEFPEFADIRVLPDWMPGELLVGLTPTAYEQFKDGTFTGFDSLYATLGTPETTAHDFGQWAVLRFGQVYHGVRLAELFQPVGGVRYAEPNGIVGDGNDIIARLDRTYTLSRGWGDCPAGCIYRESWDFAVTDDGVLLGSAPPDEAAFFGDMNHDGVVDAADYTVWRDGLGTVYNEAHYADFKHNFGAALGSGTFAGAAVPEPAGGVLMLVGAAAGVTYAGRKRRRAAR